MQLTIITGGSFGGKLKAAVDKLNGRQFAAAQPSTVEDLNSESAPVEATL